MECSDASVRGKLDKMLKQFKFLADLINRVCPAKTFKEATVDRISYISLFEIAEQESDYLHQIVIVSNNGDGFDFREVVVCEGQYEDHEGCGDETTPAFWFEPKNGRSPQDVYDVLSQLDVNRVVAIVSLYTRGDEVKIRVSRPQDRKKGPSLSCLLVDYKSHQRRLLRMFESSSFSDLLER